LKACSSLFAEGEGFEMRSPPVHPFFSPHLLMLSSAEGKKPPLYGTVSSFLPWISRRGTGV